MKKVLIAILIIVAILVVFAVGAVIYVGVSVHDKTDNTPDYLVNQEEKAVAVYLNKYLQDSMEDTKTDQKIELLLDEQELNLVLNAIANEMDIPFVKLKSFYSIYLEDGSKELEIPCSVMGFSSCVKGSLKIEEEEGKFDITIHNLSLGKLGTSSGLLKAILGAANWEKIESDLKEKHIDIELSYQKGEIYASITKEAILQIMNQMEDEEGSNYLFSAIVDILLGKDDFLDFQLDGKEKMGIVVYLQNMLFEKSYAYDLEKGTNNLTKVTNDVKTLISNEIVNVENLSLVFDYLVRGYDSLEEKKQSQIEVLDFSSIGITKNKNYKGIVERSSLTMAGLFAQSAAAGALNLHTILLGGYYDVNISEDALCGILHSLKFTGTSFAFMDVDEISYITIEGINLEIEENKMSLDVVLDVNGLLVAATLNLSSEGSTASYITLTVDSILLAGEDISQDAKMNLLRYLNIVLQDEEYLSFSPEEKTMTFDFSAFISTDPFFQSLLSSNLSNISILLKDTEEIAIRFHN